MIANGNVVKIIYSKELQDYRLLFLVGQTGTITECLFENNKNPGAYVTITKGQNKNEEWFIPLKSLQTKEMINRMRSDAVLKRFA